MLIAVAAAVWAEASGLRRLVLGAGEAFQHASVTR